MEQKLTIRISQRINAIMNVLDKALKEKYNSDKEFAGLLVVPRDNIWMCEDMIIPKQEVTGGSVKLPKEGKYSPYQKYFEDYFLNNKTHLVIGTIHSHNNMSPFFSCGDDEDLDNNAFLNLNEGLPFIDIVWSKKDSEYKSRVKIKIGKGDTKQIFTHENCDVKITPDSHTLSILEKIKSMITGAYSIDEENLKKSILPKIEIEKMMENIQVKAETGYTRYNGYTRSSCDSSLMDFKRGKVKVEVEDYDHQKKILALGCQGSETDRTNFVDIIEDEIRMTYPVYEVKSTSLIGNKTILEISCDSKNAYKKLRNRIYRIYGKFTESGRLENKVSVPIETIRDYDEDYEDYYWGLYGGNRNYYPSYVG